MADDKRLERMEKKLDDVADHLSSIDITLTAQHISLKDHMRRTALLEKEIAPIKKHVYMAQGAAGLLAIGAAAVEFLKYLKMI